MRLTPLGQSQNCEGASPRGVGCERPGCCSCGLPALYCLQVAVVVWPEQASHQRWTRCLPSLHQVPSGGCTPCGLQVHSELDPQKALQWVAASPFLPDIVLVDCMMPGGHTRPHQHNACRPQPHPGHAASAWMRAGEA